MSGLFGPKAISQKAPSAASLQLQTSCWGRAIPLLYGCDRVAPNLIWYGDFTPIATTQRQGGKGGGGGSSTTSYTYKTAVSLALCEGVVASVETAWAGKVGATIGELNLTLFDGSAGQAAPAYMTTNHPSEALGYSNLAYLFTSAYDLGSNSNLPSHTFQVIGPLSGTAPNGLDAAVELVIEALLGQAGLPESVYSGQLEDMGVYCRALLLGVSPQYTEFAPASQMIERLLEIGNTAMFASDGVLKFVPYADQVVVNPSLGNYTPVTTVQYDLTDDDFLPAPGEDPVILERSDPSDIPNTLSVSFRDATQNYVSNSVSVDNDASIEQLGRQPAPDLTYDEIKLPAIASMVAVLRLQRLNGARNRYRFRTAANYSLLEPMDIVRVTESTGTPLVAVPLRITRRRKTPNHELEFEGEEFLGTVGALPAYSYQTPGGYTVDYNADPGNVSTPFICDAPYELADTGFEIYIGAAGQGPLWGGCTVWMSTDGSTYKPIGDINGPSRHGVLSIAAGIGADPDTDTDVTVDLSASKATLASGTSSDADNATTLCIMGREVFSYQRADLVAANTYELGTYLRRGLYGSTRAAHPVGTPFARIDSAIVNVPYDSKSIGTVVYFKFTSFNVWEGGEQDVSIVTAYPYLIRGPIGGIAGGSSLLDTKSWRVGAADSQGNYTDYFDGANHDSSIVLAGTGDNPLGPNGRIVPLWKSVGAGTGANGGWENSRDLYGIDAKKSYRTSVWFRWNGVANPIVQLSPGFAGIAQLSGAITSSPVFWSHALAAGGIEKDRWYLLVGVIHGSDYNSGSSNFAGCYDSTAGRKIPFGAGYDGVSAAYGNNFGAEFRFRSDMLVTNAAQRVTQHGTNNSGCVVWFADPRFDELNGQEPSIGALLVPPSGDKGIGSPIVSDSEFSAATDDTYWMKFGPGTRIYPTGGENGGYLEFSPSIYASSVRARRSPDNIILPGKKIAIVIRYRRNGTLAPISGSTIVMDVVTLLYNTPDVADNAGAGRGVGNITVYDSGQVLTNLQWYTETIVVELSNYLSGFPTKYRFYTISLSVSNIASGLLEIDAIEAFPTA